MAHTPVKGYRELPEDVLELVNEIKDVANDVGRLVKKVESFTEEASGDGPDKVWLSVSEIGLRTSFMQLIRSITKPRGF